MLEKTRTEYLIREHVYQLAQDHPEINKIIELCQRDGVDWEQTFYLVMVGLARSNSQIKQAFLDLMLRMPPNVIFEG
jgi:hypothetical protein